MRKGAEPKPHRNAVYRLIRNNRGATAAIFAIAMPVLVGMGALAVDVGLWNVQKRQAQGAADQAAYSAAIAAKASGNGTTEARAIAANMGFVNGQNGVVITVNNPPATGAYATKTGYWEVIVERPQRLGLAGLFLSTAPVARARAVAGGTAFGNGCIIALSKTAAAAVHIMNQADVVTPTCGIYSNSAHNRTSVACGNVTGNGNGANGNCTINASVYAAGAVGGSGGVQGTLVQNSTLPSGFDNPYPGATAPSGSDCTYNVTNLAVGSSQLAAGTYCISGALSFTNTDINAPRSNVTLILLNGATLNTIPNNVHINIDAPTSGKYADIAIMSLKTGTLDFTNGNNGNGTQVTFHVRGAIYAPNAALSFTGGTQFDPTMCTQLIGSTVAIGLHANMGSNCPGPGSGSAGSPSISLVE